MRQEGFGVTQGLHASQQTPESSLLSAVGGRTPGFESGGGRRLWLRSAEDSRDRDGGCAVLARVSALLATETLRPEGHRDKVVPELTVQKGAV